MKVNFLSLILIVIVSMASGFGICWLYFNYDNITDEGKNCVGIYHTDSWNNKEATLVLNEDGTCKYPTGTKDCTWVSSNNMIIINLTDSKHEASVVEDGLILHEHFFEKK